MTLVQETVDSILQELDAAGCDTSKKLVEYFEVSDIHGLTWTVNALLQMMAKADFHPQAIGDALALAMLLGARLGRHNLL